MATPLDMSAVRKSLANFTIPPRPDMLIELQQELDSPDPDLKHIAEIIHNDVGIAGFTLKVVNSALFSLPRKIASIDHACMFLGKNRVIQLVKSVALKFTLSEGKKDAFTEKLWRSSSNVGACAMTLAKHLGFDDETADELYTTGLFHNAGMALILEQNPNYPEVLKQAYQQSCKSISDFETKELRATHELLGFLIAQVWGLSNELSNVIAYHHSPLLILATGTEKEKQVMALLKLSEHMIDLPHLLGDAKEDEEWQEFGDRLLMILNLKPSQLPEIGEVLNQAGIDNKY